MKAKSRCLCVALSLLAVSAAAVAEEESVTLEEIIVTAEKREESLQKTPIAITAIDSEALVQAGVSQAEDLNKLVPGLGIAQGGPSTQIYVRGVGNYGTNAFADPAVAFNVDGVYISRFSGISGNFFDISRVEVLKGPQGTLWGRNATGGSINLVTNKPSQAFDAGAELEVGNYHLVKGSGYLNGGITDTLSLRLAAQRTSRDGYQTDGYDDDESGAARLSALYPPSDDTSLLITGSYLKLGGKGPVHVPTTNAGFVDPGNPWLGQSVAMPIALGALPTAFLFTGVDRSNGFLNVDVKSLTAQYDSKLGGADLTVVGNLSSNYNPSHFYGPGFGVDTRTDSRQHSLEARLSGDTGRLKWLAGLYYFQEKQTENYWVDQGFLFNQTGVDAALKDTTYAAFTQETLSLTDAVRLTGGLRYMTEKKSQDGLIFGRQPQSGACATGTTAVFIDTVSAYIPQAATNGAGQSYPFTYCADTMTGSTTWDDVSWKVGIDWDVAPESMMYASISRGFKAGGYYAGGDHAIVPQPDGSVKHGNGYDPEKLFAYAVGSKNRFFGDRLQLNAEAFYWDYKKHQEGYLAPTSTEGTFNFVTQQADAHIYGLDVESDALLSDVDELSVKLQYLHAEYTQAVFINASPGPGNPSPRSVCSTREDGTYPAIWYVDCGGQQMPRSPTLSGNVDYSHTFMLSSGYKLVPSVNAQYSGSYWSAVDYNPLEKQDSYVMYGADVSLKAPDGKWSVTAYGANLNNEVVYTNAFMYPSTNSVSNGGAGNIAMVQLHAPRTYGVRFSAKF